MKPFVAVIGSQRVLACVAILASAALAESSAAWAQGSAPQASDALVKGFEDPPASARPRVWWHWLNGNVTREGIRLDLEWMKRVGIGGFQNFDAALNTPQVVEKRLAYMTPEWNDAFRYAADLAEEKGLEMAIAASPGWSETGGPWVKPEQAMKKLVWSEAEVSGGRALRMKLPEPPHVSGLFQDAPLNGGETGGHTIPELYRDVAVVAFPTSEAPQPHATVSVGDHAIDGALLSDGSLRKGMPVNFGTGDAASCITFAYDKPTTLASVLLAMPVGRDFFRSPLALPALESSDDGVSFHKVIDIPAGSVMQRTVSFPPVRARSFRVCFAAPPPPFTDLMDAVAPGAQIPPFFGGDAGQSPRQVDVRELRLFSTPRVNRAEEKAAFGLVPDYYAIPTPTVASNTAVPRDAVVDLTSHLKADGTLDWTPPRGRWKVLRFGYSLTGTENHPATAEATGLEVDKFDRALVKQYLDTYLSSYERILGPDRMGAKGLRALLVDSIEVGPSNWTESLPAQFKRLRGYDLTPWLPVLSGVIVGSAADSDRFLYDFRQTLADLIADAHYGQLAEGAHARGLVHYAESLEQGRPVLGDDMEMRRHADIPMAALWTYSLEKQGAPTPARFADLRGAASVAHIYGQNLVAAESLTSAFAPWAYSPRELKPMIDIAFALGLNRPVIHTSVHVPLADKPPGLTLLIFGQMFNRAESWAEQAGAWVSYLSRTAYLLQQGRFAADVLYFYGEEAPISALFQQQVTPDAPHGVGFDFANADVVRNRLKVADGMLVTDSGMRYRLLYLGGSSSRMTLRTLERIAELVRAGATVVGSKPMESPSLSDDPAAFRKLADALWSGADAGKGRVLSGIDVDTALERIGVARDFDYRKSRPDSNVMFLHRHLEEGELYFLTNQRHDTERTEATFRVTGKIPEIWRAETARVEPASYRSEAGRTVVSLELAPYESYFVVFRKDATAAAATVPASRFTTLTRLDAAWSLTFQPGRGAPTAALTANVGSWTEQSEAGVRYFSGTGTYARTLNVPANWKREGRLTLDLGEVRELAEVFVNGRSIGTVWHPPYRVDVTDAVEAGANRLEVRVTNLWVNRLIGDAQPGATKVTFTVMPPYRADAPLRPSGLLGPVTLQRESVASR